MWADLNLIFSEQFRGLLFCQCCRTSLIQFAVNQSKISLIPNKPGKVSYRSDDIISLMSAINNTVTLEEWIHFALTL